MKIKHLLTCAAIALGCGSMWAQTWTDYTSKITNPSFETGTPLSDPKTGYSTTCDGWTVTPASASNSQIGIVASGATIQGVATSVTTSDGGNYFYIRNNWNADTNYNITQTIASSSTLPAGYYKLSLKAMTNAGNWSTCSHTVSLQEAGNTASTKTMYSTGATWTDFTVMVYKKSADTDLKISANLKAGSSGGGQHYQLLIDDIQLQYCESLGATASAPVEVTDYISNPTIQNTNKTYVPRGWTAGSRTVGNSNYTESTGDTRLEAWSGGNMNFDYCQTLNGLKDGTYKLVATCGDSNDRGGYLYATSNEVTEKADMPASAAEISTQIAVVNNTLTIGIKSETTNGGSWMTGDNFKLYYLGDGIDITDWTNAKSDATTALGKYDEKYATTERKAVTDAMEAADPTTSSQMATMVSDLNTKVATYTKKAANEVLVESKSALTTFINTTLPATYPNSSNEVLNTDISKWTTSDYSKYTADEHWNGQSNQTYYEQSHSNPDMWMQSSWSIDAEQTVNLPAGKYAFVVTARASSGVTSKMTVNDTEVALSNVGNEGFGIATDGEATYDMSKTYATTTGRGWEYAYVEFEVTEAKDVTFKLESSASSEHQWVSIANPVLYYNDAAKEAMELIRKNAILETITETLGTVPESEVMNATVLSTLNTKKTAAQNATTSNTVEELNTINSELVDAITDANTSIENYIAAKSYMDGIQTSVNTLDEAGKASYAANEAYTSVKTAYDNRTLESLTDDQKTAMKAALVTAVKAQTSDNAVFTLALNNPSFEEGTNGWENRRNTTGTYDYKTVADGPADGAKSLNAWAAQVNYINVWQKQTLPSGTYTLSAKARTNAEPLENKTQVRTYINGVNASNSAGLTYTADETAWNDASKWITLTTTFSIIEETEVEMGIYSTGKNIANNSQGWFQVDDFQLVRNGAAPTTCTRSTKSDKFGTICLPYAFSATGATVYSATINTEGDAVTLETVETPVAGIPYIYKATADSQTFTYSGAPIANPVDAAPLTGVFTATLVPVGSYVMQTKDGEQSFYIVAEGAQPTLSANKAYLTVPASNNAKMITIGEDSEATAINAINALTTGNAKIYDLNGRELKSLQKGVNIVNGVKVYVK